MSPRLDHGHTAYSPTVPGDVGNYRWRVRFDRDEDGYVGITQWQEDGTPQRVLLTPTQFTTLFAFASAARYGART